MKMRLHSAALSAAILAFSACSGPPASDAKDTSEETPVPGDVSSALPAIELPAFPDLPTPKSELAADDAGRIYYSTRSPYDFSVLLNDFDAAPKTTGFGDLYLPEGASETNKVPAMVILHGSGGITEGREHEHAKRFVEQGIAGFVIDYYAPRGVTDDTPYMLKTMATTETDLTVDAFAALARLQDHPSIDPSKIGVIGFSYGGMATRYAMDERLAAKLSPDGPDFALHVDFYGPCHQTTGHSGTTGAPYLAVYGDQDNSVDPAECARVQQDLIANGTPVEAHVLDGAGHAWENAAPQAMGKTAFVRGCTFTFDPEDGTLLIDGKPATRPPEGASRNERAQARMALGADAMHCVGQGYLVGNDPEADGKAKMLLDAFLARHFFPSSGN